MADQLDLKIAYIGGGSRGWAHILMADLALCPHLRGELVLYDIDRAAAEANAAIADAVFAHPAAVTRFRTRAVKDAASALRGADFVVLSIEPGPTEMRYADLVIPARYGILQPVGDTVGPGGLLRALRTIPIKMHYAHLVMEHCPSAWVINYTNPMTLSVSALYAAEPRIKAFGCCHEVFGTQRYLAQRVKAWFGVPAPARDEIALDIAGVNHFTLATAAAWKGQDLMPHLKEMIERRGFFRSRARAAALRTKRGEWFGRDSRIACDFLRRFGVLGAAGDRHLAEFVPWYLDGEATLHAFGVVLTPYAWRVARDRQPRRRPADVAAQPLRSSGEEGVRQMCALLGMAPLVTNVNVPNRGQVAGLPVGHVVESYASFRRDRVQPLIARPLPAGAQALMDRVAAVQSLTLQAALQRDRRLALEALLLDPLVRIPTGKAARMLDEMLAFARRALPGW